MTAADVNPAVDVKQLHTAPNDDGADEHAFAFVGRRGRDPGQLPTTRQHVHITTTTPTASHSGWRRTANACQAAVGAGSRSDRRPR